jgi:hypothetical protein
MTPRPSTQTSKSKNTTTESNSNKSHTSDNTENKNDIVTTDYDEDMDDPNYDESPITEKDLIGRYGSSGATSAEIMLNRF